MQQVVLKHTLSEKPKAEDFDLVQMPAPTCPEGGVLVQVKYISLDPYVGHLLHKGHMGQTAPEPARGLIPGAVVGEVIESRSDKAGAGDHVHSMDGGWVEVVALTDSQFTVVDTDSVPLSAYAGVLGMPGLTAWAGVTQLARVTDGDVFLVNAAAGPVGGTAGQIARQCGAKTVIGIAGGTEKCRLVEKVYGFDACLDYREAGWREQLGIHAPDGITVHYENVGADMLAFALSHMQPYARVILCGLAAHYHDPEPARILIGPIIGKRASVHGLVVYDFYDRWQAFRDAVAPWVTSGRITICEDRSQGLGEAPALMQKLVNGRNVGKCVVAL
ncbi:MAG: NADP-dependent oxidoreductase [Hyphomonadaceae bacterium]|nr:NADP-dependent oxidoreductase [Hyphomonadaceae bacterium]